MKDIKEVLVSVFRVKVDEINSDTEIKNIDSWNSMTHMEMIANLEQEFNIEFDIDEIMAMTKVEVIEKIVNKKLNYGD